MFGLIDRHCHELTGRLQAGTANQETVNIGLSSKLAAVLLADGATVDDANALLGLGRNGIAEPVTDGSVDLLGLLSGGDLSSADSPIKRRQVSRKILMYKQ